MLLSRHELLQGTAFFSLAPGVGAPVIALAKESGSDEVTGTGFLRQPVDPADGDDCQNDGEDDSEDVGEDVGEDDGEVDGEVDGEDDVEVNGKDDGEEDSEVDGNEDGELG